MALARKFLPAAFCLLPLLAQAAPLTPARVFADAAPFPKLVLLGLIIATVAAVVVAIRKLSSGSQLAGGSAFVSGLRAGGPLAGLLGGAYTGLNMAIGLSNVAQTPPMRVLAPGFAEIILLIGVGMLSGAVAVIVHGSIESRIDRNLLKA
jgi:hypothetical protein